MAKKDFKLLIAEDDPEVRRFLMDFCDVNGYQAEWARNGLEALTRVREDDTYALAIVDYMMPEMDGLQFVREVKENGTDLPIIAMSGWGSIMERPFLEAGAFLFLSKPFDPHVLEKEIELIRSVG
jgi:DNA-binding response OmpR family regulator